MIDPSFTGLNIDVSFTASVPSMNHLNDTLYMVEELDQETDMITHETTGRMVIDDLLYLYGHHQNLL
jgi:hypothetical protein